MLKQQIHILLKENDINHVFVEKSQHSSLGIIDSMCRTIRGLINKYGTANNTTKFIDVFTKID